MLRFVLVHRFDKNVLSHFIEQGNTELTSYRREHLHDRTKYPQIPGLGLYVGQQSLRGPP